ncbi:MAG: lytic transglycosylase domain-containing protein [Candidatus Methylomirabilales bacterium]
MRKTVFSIPLVFGLLLPLSPPSWVNADDQIYRRVEASGVIYTNVPPHLSFPSETKAIPARLRRLIKSAADRYGVDFRLVEAIIAVESDFNPWAVSPKGAMGLMQLMPKTARRYAVENPFDPVQNIGGGIRYLRDLVDRFPGDLRTILAAYNAGETAVERYRGVPPYRETREYIKKVLRRYSRPPPLLFRPASQLRTYRYTGPGGRPIYSNIPPHLTLQ